MRTTKTTLFAIGLVVLAILFARSFALEPPPPGGGDRAAADTVVVEAAASSGFGTGSEPTPQREAVPATDGSAAWLNHPYRLELDVLVVDRVGLPVAGHSLRLSLPSSTMIEAPVASGPDGRLSMSWPSRLASGSVVLVDDYDTRRSVALQHGTKTRVTLLGTRGGPGPEVVLSFVQHPSSPTTIAVTNKVSYARDFDPPNEGVDPGLPHGLHPYVVFDTQAAVAKVEAPGPEASLAPMEMEIALDSNQWVMSAMALGGFSGNNHDSPTGQSEPDVTAARIVGTVFGEDGKPAAKLPVVVLGAGPQPLQQVETDEVGQFVFENLAAAEFTVRAGGTEAGLATVPATVTTGTTPVILNLQRGSCVRGKALDADGMPIRSAMISWRAVDGTWCDETTSHDDGSFTFANLPGTAGTVLLWAPDDEHPLPIASAQNVLCDAGELVLQATPAAGSTLRIAPVLPEHTEGGVAVRLWNLDLGIATRLPDPEAGQPHHLGKLAAGWYRVEMYHATTGWFDAGRHWLDGKADCDLGRVVLPAPAKVKFELDPGALPSKDQQAFEVCSLRSDVDVRFAGVGPTDTLLLPGGAYVFGWRGRDGAVHFHRFTTTGGRDVTVRPTH